MVYCPNCGQEQSDGIRFCANCGTAIPEFSNVPETKKSRLQKLPFRLTPKAIGIATACLVVAVVVVVILLLSGGKKNNYALYVKDGELYYTGISSIKPLEVTDELGNAYAGYLTQLSKDGKILFFPDNYDSSSYTYGLYYRYVNKPKKDAVKLASDVSSYSVSESGKCVTYLTKDGKLYQHDLKDKEKIDSDVESYRVSKDGKKLFFIDSDDKLYFKNGNKDKEKMASDVDRIQFVDEKFSYVYYTKDENLYKQKPGKDKEKLVSDMHSLVRVYASGAFYYLEATSDEKPLSDFVNDDMAEADATITKPEAPKYPYYSDYATYDEYSAAYESYWDAYEKYWDALEAYRDKEDRDELREDLKKETLEYVVYTLYYFDGKKSQEVADGLVCEPSNYAANAPVLICSVGKGGRIASVNLSEIDYTWEVKNQFSQSAEQAGDCYIAVEGTATKLSYDDAQGFDLSKDGTLVYFMADVSEDDCGDLYQMKISGGKPQKAEKYDTDVYSGFFLADGTYAYFKDVEDGNGDLYIEKKQIDKDTYLYGIRSSEDGICAYLSDYEDGEGTLMMYQGGKAKKVANDVCELCLTPNGEILYLTDFDEDKEEGDLYLFNGSKSKQVDDGVSQIINTYYED